MEKKIVLRFASRCKKCGGQLSAGESAYWLGSGKGATHLQCPNSNPDTKVEKPKSSAPAEDRMTYDYWEIRDVFMRMTTGGDTAIREMFPKNYSRAAELKASEWERNSKWTGCTIAEMHEWIRSGYHVAGLEGITGLIPARPRRRLKYGEEGDELLIDLVHSGDDNPFVEWEKRNTKPGLSVEIHTVVNSHFPAETMTAYQRWIARALQTLDENGVDMEVNLVMPNGNLWSQRSRTETLIRVRKPGEASDFANWSAMFSPGGYRQLGFAAWTMHAEKAQQPIHFALGQALDYGKWTVDYDEDKNVVVFGNSQRDYAFPEHEMTEKLISVLNQLTG